MILKIVLTLLLDLHFNFARVQVFPDETYIDCSDNGVAKYIDYSGLEFEYVNDTEYFLNGKSKVE